MIPFQGAVPITIFTLFAVYVPSFISTYLSNLKNDLLGDEVDAVVKDATVTLGQPATGGSRDEDETQPQVAELKVSGQKTVISKKKKGSRPFSTLLLGSPSPSSSFLSMTTFLINLVAVLMAADFLLSARLYAPCEDLSFTRLGYVSPSEANFLLREPDQAQMPVTLEIRVKDPQAPFDNPRWQKGGDVKTTSNETDYTASIAVQLVHSSQRMYEWRTSNNHSGEFLAAPRPGMVSDYHGGNFTFLATSCILPRFPYHPSNDKLAIPGLKYLADILPSLGAQFMLFMGDFIYVDVPRRFGAAKEDYLQKYRHVYASPDWPPVSQNLSWIHVLDDHEIANDWSSNTTGVYETAIEPWQIYNNAVNPPAARQAGSSLARKGATWFEFSQGPTSFFMLDTRSYRSSNDDPESDPEKTMLGKDQLHDFLYWLTRPEPRGVKWKVVASSVPFTKNWPVNNKDTWGGFLSERKVILEAMWEAGARGMGVVILSGDRHEFAATKFPPPADSRWSEEMAPHEFSASPLNQFAAPIPTYKQTDGEDVMLRYALLALDPHRSIIVTSSLLLTIWRQVHQPRIIQVWFSYYAATRCRHGREGSSPLQTLRRRGGDVELDDIDPPGFGRKAGWFVLGYLQEVIGAGSLDSGGR